jgi:hypothetical protein
MITTAKDIEDLDMKRSFGWWKYGTSQNPPSTVRRVLSGGGSRRPSRTHAACSDVNARRPLMRKSEGN